MRIGLVTFWFNRGQGTVGRHLRDSLDALGFETFVLARPTTRNFTRPAYADDQDIWNQPGVTYADGYEVTQYEYESWIQANQIDTVFFDQNYQFETIAELRASGIRTIGRFVRESFGSSHVSGARTAYTDIYDVTPSGRDRMSRLGLDCHLVPWGCHPEDIRDHDDRYPETLFFFPGGYLLPRKPILSVIEAFGRVPDPTIRLLIKVQAPPRPRDEGPSRRARARLRAAAARLAGRRPPASREEPARSWVESGQELLAAIEPDPRVRLEIGDVTAAEYFDTMSHVDVCVTPARWEGLGLHLYEATAMGIPLIVNDVEPLNEIAVAGLNGIIVPGESSRPRRSGAPVHEVSVDRLADAIRQACDSDKLRSLKEGARLRREQLSWDSTVAALAEMLGAPHRPHAPEGS